MRVFISCLILMVTFSVTAQNTERIIVIKDAETDTPVEDATVFVMKTKQSFLTNKEGKVTFLLNGTSNIQISHSSYQPITVRSTTLKPNENVLLLKSDVRDLDEIIVTKQHPQKILKTLIENSEKALTVPARLKVYTREFFKLNGTYSYYNDGLLNFQIFGKNKNFNSNILVEQNRSFGLVNEEISGEVLGYNLNNIIENYYNFKYLEPLLEASAKKRYEFLIKAFKNNDDHYKMIVTPLEDSKGLLDDFSIIYDVKRKLILEVSSTIAPTAFNNVKEKKSIGAKNIYKSNFKTIYRLDSSNYYLISSKEEIGFEYVGKNRTNDIEVRNYFITTNFSNQNYSFKESEVFKDKTLYNKKNTILSNYWDTSGLTATEEEEQIILSIEDRED